MLGAPVLDAARRSSSTRSSRLERDGAPRRAAARGERPAHRRQRAAAGRPRSPSRCGGALEQLSLLERRRAGGRARRAVPERPAPDPLGLSRDAAATAREAPAPPADRQLLVAQRLRALRLQLVPATRPAPAAARGLGPARRDPAGATATRRCAAGRSPTCCSSARRSRPARRRGRRDGAGSWRREIGDERLSRRAGRRPAARSSVPSSTARCARASRRPRRIEPRGRVRARARPRTIRRSPLLTGSIDLLATRTAARCLVVDYKTDRVEPRRDLDGARRGVVRPAARGLRAGLPARAARPRVDVVHVYLERPDEPVIASYAAAGRAGARVAAAASACAGLLRRALRGQRAALRRALRDLPRAQRALLAPGRADRPGAGALSARGSPAVARRRRSRARARRRPRRRTATRSPRG